MQRIELFHPRIFSDQEWADGYYKRNAKNITRTGKRLVELLERNGFQRGKVLDVGCGFGAVCIEIAKRFPNAEIVGIDLARPLLDKAQSLAGQSNCSDRIQFLEGDVHKLDFPDDTFDVVINTYMLHIAEKPVNMLNEIERVTTAQGKILITDLRRMVLALLIKKFRTTFTLEEARYIIETSDMRTGRYAKGPIWWDYMVGL